MTAGGDEINALIQEAEAKLAAGKQAGVGKVASLPVYFLLGETGSAKTTVMVHSGLEPELLAGQIYQGGNVAPTTGANVWFSRGSLFIEAGGPLPADSSKWARLIKRLQPRGSMPGGGTPPRVAVVFFDSEIFTRANAQDVAADIARNFRARLGEMSQAMGLNLPVYVVFSRMDRVPFFAEFVRNLSNEEVLQVLGVTLPMTGRRSEGAYAGPGIAAPQRSVRTALQVSRRRAPGVSAARGRTLPGCRPHMNSRASSASSAPWLRSSWWNSAVPAS